MAAHSDTVRGELATGKQAAATLTISLRGDGQGNRRQYSYDDELQSGPVTFGKDEGDSQNDRANADVIRRQAASINDVGFVAAPDRPLYDGAEARRRNSQYGFDTEGLLSGSQIAPDGRDIWRDEADTFEGRDIIGGIGGGLEEIAKGASPRLLAALRNR